MLTLLVLLPTIQAAPSTAATTNAPAELQSDEAFVEIHQQALVNLASRRREFKAGKCKVFDVCQASMHLRYTEQAISSTKDEKIATFARHAAVLRELEEEAPTDRDKVWLQKSRETAEATLLHVKSLEMTAADLERDQQLYRSVVMSNLRSKERQPRRIVVRPQNNPRLDLIYPTRPPRFVR